MIRACGRRGRGRQARRRRNEGDPPSEGGYRGCRPLIELWKHFTSLSLFQACFGACDGDDIASNSDSENLAARSEAAASPAMNDAPVGRAAGLSVDAPPFVPAAKRVPASASKPPPPPKSKSSLRASANVWKPNPAAPEWKPAASFSSTASPAIAPTVSTGAGVGGGAPHHMGAVSPHLMGGAPLGPVHPQPMYQTAFMGHHPQQPGNAVPPPPASPFFHGQMQHPRAIIMDMEEGMRGGGLHAWGGNSPHDHGGNGEWDMAARAAGILEEVDSPAQPRPPENTGAEAGAEWAR